MDVLFLIRVKATLKIRTKVIRWKVQLPVRGWFGRLGERLVWW